MKIALCDDRPECLTALREAVEAYNAQTGASYTIEEYTDGSSLLQAVRHYDTVFLDVELGDSNGIAVAQQLQQQNKNTAIVIVTAHRGYLDDAMDIHAVRFIDKPITPERVFSALKKIAADREAGSITVHAKDNRIITVRRKDIIYAEARLRTSLLVTTEEMLTVREGIHQLQEWLQYRSFAIPHNSYVVNMNYIKIFRREEVVLTADTTVYRIPVSSRRQAAFKKSYIRFIGEGLQ